MSIVWKCAYLHSYIVITVINFSLPFSRRKHKGESQWWLPLEKGMGLIEWGRILLFILSFSVLVSLSNHYVDQLRFSEQKWFLVSSLRFLLKTKTNQCWWYQAVSKIILIGSTTACVYYSGVSWKLGALSVLIFL